MKRSMFLSLIISLGVISSTAFINSGIQDVFSALGQKATSGAKAVAQGSWNLAKKYPKPTASVAMLAALPFVMKKAANSYEFSSFLKTNVPMLGCLALAGYDLTVGLLGDLTDASSGVFNTGKLYFKIKSNKEEQAKLVDKISIQESSLYAQYDRYLIAELKNKLAILKSMEADLKKEMKEAKEKANVSQVLYRIMRGSITGAAGYQLFQK